MKKEFTPGDYCRFPNSEIPRVLDILRANRWKVFNLKTDFSDCMCIMYDGYELIPNQEPDEHELSRHDFMVIALRLEEGMGICGVGSTNEQRAHINRVLHDLGLSVNCIQEDCPCTPLPREFRGGMFMAVIGCQNPIPYEEWCRRLCVEPIGETCDIHSTDMTGKCFNCGFVLPDHQPQTQTQPEFDPNSNFEVSDDGVEWLYADNFIHYVGKTKGGRHVIQMSDDKVSIFLHIRNTPQFTAAMLEVGEWMIIEDDKELGVGEEDMNGHLIRRVYGGFVSYTDPSCTWLDLNGKPDYKGRRVKVNIATEEI